MLDYEISNNEIYYRIKAKFIDGSAEYSNVELLRRSDVEIFSVHLFPNPTTGLFSLSVQQSGVNQFYDLFQLYDISGVLIEEYTRFKNRIFDISSLPPGLYAYKIVVKGKVFVGKIIKI